MPLITEGGQVQLVDGNAVDAIGEVQATPTANTMLARLKDISDGVAGIVVGATTIADGADVAQGTTTDAEAADNGTVVAILKRLRTLLNGGLPASLGQKTKAASLPVTLASDEDSLNVAAAQATHDNLNLNANLQVGDADVAVANPVPIQSDGDGLKQTPTVTAGAYAADDNLGGLLTFANAAKTSGGGGVIKDITIIDDASQSAEIELWLFDQTFTAGADNAAWTPVETDLENLITVISTADGSWYTGGATGTVCCVEVARRFDLTGTSLFGRLVIREIKTYAATDDLTARINILQD
jgi:hypothetical protein